MKPLKIVLASIAVLLSLATLALPVFALMGGLKDVRVLWATPEMRELVFRLFAGPLVTLALSVIMLVMIASRRCVPGWMVLIGLLGTAFTARLPPGIGHDFSHIIFNSCSGYGQMVFRLCMGLGTCILFLGDFQLRPLVRRFHAWRLGEGLEDEAPASSRRD